MKERTSIISSTEPLSINKQCELLGVNRSTIYYQPKPESDENLEIMNHIDKHNLDHPTHGVLQMQDYLFLLGFQVNHKRVRRLMRKMDIMAIYPKCNLSKLGQAKYKYPYLLRGLDINRKNQVWEIDITYIPMRKGFFYLTAIIDVYSRYIVGWNLSNSLEAQNQIDVLQEAIDKYGKPEIVNSDQGAQYTSALWTEYLTSNSIQISMDGKGRATDNIYIERFWRTIKRDWIYLNPAENGNELFKGIDYFINYYNTQKTHQGINREIPVKIYNLVS